MISILAIYVTCNLDCWYGKKMHDMLERQPHDNAQPNHNFYGNPLGFNEAWIYNDSIINSVLLELKKTRCFMHGDWFLWSWKPTHSKQVCYRKISFIISVTSKAQRDLPSTLTEDPQGKEQFFNHSWVLRACQGLSIIQGWALKTQEELKISVFHLIPKPQNTTQRVGEKKGENRENKHWAI